MKKYAVILFLLILGQQLQAQKYTIEKSYASFYSHATLEDIKAENTKVAGLFNGATSDIAFSVPIKDFEFAKSLMKEHFNEKYLESDKYPKATFQGKLSGYNLKSSGIQNAKAVGKLTIHGVTKDVEIVGTLEMQSNKVLMKSKFIVKLEDHKVTIPQLVWQNIAEQVEVTIDFVFKPQ